MAPTEVPYDTRRARLGGPRICRPAATSCVLLPPAAHLQDSKVIGVPGPGSQGPRGQKVLRRGHDTPPLKALAQVTEQIADAGAVEQRPVGDHHATPSSWGATKIPRLRKLAGACSIASIRAAALLKGNQNTVSRRSAAHAPTPRPSRVARCSASAVRKTSHARRRCPAARRPAAWRIQRRARAGSPPETRRPDAIEVRRYRQPRGDRRGRPVSSSDTRRRYETESSARAEVVPSQNLRWLPSLEPGQGSPVHSQALVTGMMPWEPRRPSPNDSPSVALLKCVYRGWRGR